MYKHVWRCLYNNTSKAQTFMHVRQEGFLTQLLSYPEDVSAELDGRCRVLWEKLSQMQQTRGLRQTPEVFGILRQPRAEHGRHRSEESGSDNVLSHLFRSIFKK